MRTRIAPTITLFLLAPLFGEFLLGNLKLSELYYLPFLAPLYGGGALLIREIARRHGRGYATMLILGAAYAVIEEGLVDQLFFNPGYFAGQAELMETVVAGTGVDAWLVLILFAMHAIWSTCVPIVLVEGLFSRYGPAPWLGRVGLAVVATVFVAGSIWLGYTIYQENDFLATAPQLTVTALAVVILIAAAFIGGSRQTPRNHPIPAPKPWVTAAAALTASSLFMLTELLPGWSRIVACLAIALAYFIMLYRWSSRTAWTFTHTLATAAGAIITYAWVGAFMAPETGPKTAPDHVGTAGLIFTVLVLLYLAFRGTASADRPS